MNQLRGIEVEFPTFDFEDGRECDFELEERDESVGIMSDNFVLVMNVKDHTGQLVQVNVNMSATQAKKLQHKIDQYDFTEVKA